jgi:hypothetical protein
MSVFVPLYEVEQGKRKTSSIGSVDPDEKRYLGGLEEREGG